MTWIKLNVKNPVLEKGVHWQTQEFKSGTHNGIDLIGKGLSTDWEIAIEDGIVEEVDYSWSRGYYVGIRINKDYLVRYLHIKKGTIQVKKGEHVVKGQRIGFMGNSGYTDSTQKKHVGTHLHIAVVYKGKFVNPLEYLEGTKSFDGSTPSEDIYYQSSLINATNYLPKVHIGTNDYVGILKTPMDCLKIEQLTYRVQAIGRTNYYSWVTGCSDKIYAGVQGKKIKKLQIKGNYKYRVYILTNEKNGTGKWLPWVKGESDYAGLNNYPITAVQIKKV